MQGTRPKSVPAAPPAKADAQQRERSWAALEARVEDLVTKIKPNHSSDSRRCCVSNYVKGLIKKCFLPEQQVEAYMFGSVPLKTYLPDGDIDLAVFQGKGPKLRDVWLTELSTLLEEEGRNVSSLFRIKDVHIINAEVKLLKCLVDNIVVDISFDTLGGLCTVAFLESIDRHIGKEHLFKRSIILVKAWCYYESRLLGAHHGLLSTYALETMVLYIFNMYHQELQSPLKVLRKFLEVFSSFDWDAHALSLQGPIPVSSLPEPKVEPVAGSEEGALLRGDVLRGMLNMYSPRPQQGQVQNKLWQSKPINIVDPLLPTNNLGRSVTKANKARIRKAFSHGSVLLDSIFAKTGQEAIKAVDSFFRNTWNAQRAQLSARAQVEVVPPNVPLSIPLPQPGMLRSLMVPGTMPAPPQNQPGPADLQLPGSPMMVVGYGAPAAAVDSNGGVSLGRSGRAFSGPLPERPRSSASNASASSDPAANQLGGEAWGRAQMGSAAQQSMLGDGALLDQRRHELPRTGMLGIDPGGHPQYQQRESTPAGPHYQVGFDATNGMLGMQAANEAVLMPIYPYPVPSMPHAMIPIGTFQRYHLPAMQAYSTAMGMPNGRNYPVQQQHLHPASTGHAPMRPGPHHNGTPAGQKAELGKVQDGEPFALVNGSLSADLLEGDLKMLSQHLEVARHCHAYVSALDEKEEAGSVAGQPKAKDYQQQQPQHQPFRLSSQQQSYLRSSRSQLFEHPRMQQMHAQRQGAVQRGIAASRGHNASGSQRQRTPGRSNSFDDLHHFRSTAANSGPPAQKHPYASGPRNQHPPQAAADAAAAVRAGAPSQPAAQPHAAAAAINGDSNKAASSNSATGLPASLPEASALHFEAPQTPTGQSRPPGAFEGAPSPASSPGPQNPALHVRTLADAVREGPVVQRGQQQPPLPQQPQPEGGLLSPGKTQPHAAPYSSAVLGLGRAQRPQAQNGPASGQPRTGAPAPAAAASNAAALSSMPTGHAQPRPPASVASGNPHPWGRQRGDGQGPDGGPQGRERNAPEPHPPLASAPAQLQPKQQPEPPPARFILDNEAEFPVLGAVKTKRRQNGPLREPPSPPGSVIITPSADSKPTSPVCTPAAGRGAANASHSMGNSPASGWGNRPDARVALTALFDLAGASSKSEGSSPTAAAVRGGVWSTAQQQGQLSQAAWTGAPVKAGLSSSAQGSSPRSKK